MCIVKDRQHESLVDDAVFGVKVLCCDEAPAFPHDLFDLPWLSKRKDGSHIDSANFARPDVENLG